MISRCLLLAASLALAGCDRYTGPTAPDEPKVPATLNTNCPLSERDMYGYCIPPPPPPPCRFLDTDGKPYPDCTVPGNGGPDKPENP